MSHELPPRPPRAPALSQNYGLLASPPPLQVVVARAFVSCALSMRAQLDVHEDTPAAAQLISCSRAWLAEHRFDRLLHDTEAASLASPAGSLEASLRERFGLLGEAAGVMAWALRRAALAAPDAAVEAADAAATLGFLTDAGATLATSARLRDREETGRYADIAGALHWRIQRQMLEPGTISMAHWRPETLAWPEDVTPAEFIGDDLAAAGRVLTSLTNQELLPLLQGAAERHRAALWLLGQNRDYWSVAAQIA